MQIRSPTFEPGEEIPAVHTCEGDDSSPELRFSGAPAAAKSLALVVQDPDAPDPKAPKRTFVHWVVYDLPPDCRGLGEGTVSATLPESAHEGLNDWNRTGYGGPCPPIGRHRYFFRLFALDVRLGDLGKPSRAKLEQAMEGHVLETAELMGTYEKRKK